MKRGEVYVVKYELPDKPGQFIKKYALNLQEGCIVDDCPTFTALNLTTKRVDAPYAWDVVLTPKESNSPNGVRVIGNQLHTIPKKDIKELAYKLSPDKMKQVDEILFMGVGLVKYEDLQMQVDIEAEPAASSDPE